LALNPPAAAHRLGVRPEHLHLVDDSAWRGVVSVVEPTGADTYIVIRTEAGDVTLRTAPGAALQPGQSVGLGLSPEHAHWFNTQGERIA
jgi:multiple sugar transport system ATP-binding protein